MSKSTPNIQKLNFGYIYSSCNTWLYIFTCNTRNSYYSRIFQYPQSVVLGDQNPRMLKHHIPEYSRKFKESSPFLCTLFIFILLMLPNAIYMLCTMVVILCYLHSVCKTFPNHAPYPLFPFCAISPPFFQCSLVLWTGPHLCDLHLQPLRISCKSTGGVHGP